MFAKIGRHSLSVIELFRSAEYKIPDAYVVDILPWAKTAPTQTELALQYTSNCNK